MTLWYTFYMQDNTLLAQNLNHYLSFLTILGTVGVVFFSFYLAYLIYTKKTNRYLVALSSYVFPLGFFITVGGVFLTLYYEYALQYLPCDLCWYQRIFLYPQMFMFGYAWYKKDKAVLPYALLLSIIGFVVAFYHHLLQMGFDIMKPCSTAPFAVSCSKPSFIEFGFVTFPFMAVVLFGFLSLLMVVAIRFKR